MNAVKARNPDAVFDIYTLVPPWFFDDSIQGGFNYHNLKTDVGLVQTDPMSEDLPGTLQSLEAFFSGMDDTVKALVEAMKPRGFDAVISDISPLGLRTAGALGIPGYLVENFTWDWIYAYYLDTHPEFGRYINQLERIYRKADFHIQTEPVCQPGPCLLTSPPVSRKPRMERNRVRSLLEIQGPQKVVLITMGGIPTRFQFLEQLSQKRDVVFIIPGGSDRLEFRDNLRLLPHHSEFYHPDLMNAADAAVGKAGYSTVAEAYWAGIAFGYFLRAGFRESVPFAPYIQTHLSGIEIKESDFENAGWMNALEKLLSRPHMLRKGPNGADEIAGAILA